MQVFAHLIYKVQDLIVFILLRRSDMNCRFREIFVPTHRPSICRRLTFSTAVKWSWQGVAVVEVLAVVGGLALVMLDWVLSRRNRRCWAALEEHFRQRRRFQDPPPLTIFGERSTVKRILLPLLFHVFFRG